MIVKNKTKNNIIATNVALADTFMSRFIGLMGRSSLAENEGLVITNCNSIHMFFMRFAIDVIFVSADHKVISLVERIKPWHLSPIFFKSSYCVELPAGAIEKSNVEKNDLLELVQS